MDTILAALAAVLLWAFLPAPADERPAPPPTQEERR